MFLNQKKEKYLWIGVTFCLALFLIIFNTSPFLSAQTRESQTETENYAFILKEMMTFIQNYYVDDVDAKALYEGAMKGMFESLEDPYSIFLSVADIEDLSETTTGKFGGVGLYISKYIGDDTSFDEKHLPYVRVVAPIEGSPAYKLGISAGDYIIKIGDKPTDNMSLDEVLKHLRGKPGTPVNITILRGEDIIFPVDIVRENIVVPTVRSAMIGKTAYLRIIQFTPVTPDAVKEALNDFKKKRYNSLILDLRGNPGGLLASVNEVANYFLSDEVIVSTKSKIPSENKIFKASKKVLVPEDIPIVVLIDRGSASASEILAGALSDNKRAILVGQKTYGKGSVQQVREIGDTGFKLTMSRYYTPDGTNIDKIGIEPDIKVEEKEFTDEELESYKKLIEEFVIQTFIKNTPSPTERDIVAFMKQLEKDDIVLEERFIRKLIKNELNKTNNNPPVYDLEFDIELQKAMSVIENKEYEIK